MKKIFCVFLSLMFILSFALSSLAANVNVADGSASFDLTASYITASQSDTYSIDIVWGSMEFEYHEADKVWNPTTHSYVANGAPYWTCEDGANAITVTNHSSKPVTASLSYTSAANYSNITASFDKSTLNLAAPAENSAQATAPADTAKVTLSGALKAGSADVKIGSVTVTIASSAGGSSSGGGVDTTTPAGYLGLYSSFKPEELDLQYNIYNQSDNVYTAEFTASKTIKQADTSIGADTIISINGTPYYIYEAGDEQYHFFFKPGDTVTISTEKYPDIDIGMGIKSKAKTTLIEEGKTYRMTIDLSAMTATLAEIS